jgi:hypothetical protein
MRSSFRFEAAEFLPEPAAVLKAQGVAPGRDPGERTKGICRAALELLAETAAPRGLYTEIPVAEFPELYRGEGRNSDPSPLATIAPRAEGLALFALTLGPAITERIDQLLAGRDFALGAMLDSAASEAAERVADTLEEHYRAERGGADKGAVLLRYSPGYCGWHISGQKRLFAALAPDEIGLSLRDTFLMEPLKSISGVFVSGPGEIHLFEDNYDFCDDCRTHSCRARIRAIQRAGEA